jgi:DNA/RNA-binding domain of Phe-tRNA-synthetase-like protein
MTVHISLSNPLIEAFPGVNVIAFAVRDIDPKGIASIGAQTLAREANLFAAQFKTPERLMEEVPLQLWREVYRTMGLKSSSHRSSIEALGRRALRGAMPAIMPLVDLYNASSLASLSPLGGADLEKLGPNPHIQLRFAEADDTFEPLGGAADDFPMKSSVAVYALGKELVCWGFNCRDSARFALDPNTSAAMFVSESLTPAGRVASETGIEHLRQALSGCAVVGNTIRLDRMHAQDTVA